MASGGRDRSLARGAAADDASWGGPGWRRALHPELRAGGHAVTRHLAIGLDLSGLELIDPTEAYVVTPLHEGFADALALLHLPLDLRFAARDELFEWRLAGGLLRDTQQLRLCPSSAC